MNFGKMDLKYILSQNENLTDKNNMENSYFINDASECKYLITNMFIFDVVGSVSIGLKKEQDKRMCG
jgi:hypothetical protein